MLGLSASGALAYSVASGSKLGLVAGRGGAAHRGRRRCASSWRLRSGRCDAAAPSSRTACATFRRARSAGPTGLALAGAVLVAFSMAHGWLDFLDGRKHPAPSAAGHVLWIVGRAGRICGGGDRVLRPTRTARSGRRPCLGLALGRSVWQAQRLGGAIHGRPGGRASRCGADEWSVVRDDALALSAVATGRLAALAARVPVVPAVILLAVAARRRSGARLAGGVPVSSMTVLVTGGARASPDAAPVTVPGSGHLPVIAAAQPPGLGAGAGRGRRSPCCPTRAAASTR